MTKAPSPADGEFALIERYFAPLARHPGSVGLKDDVALLTFGGTHLVIKTDAIVSDVHFFMADPADLVAKKALRVNLSDLAAKGAKPIGYSLALGLPPDFSEAWLAAFCRGLQQDQAEYDLDLLGGDLTRCPMGIVVSITIFGTTPNRVPRRGDARPGDRILVSGYLGDAFGGLMVKKGRLSDLSAPQRAYLSDRYLLPQPRLALGQALVDRGLVNAMMDISDGLAGDLRHICNASGLGAVVAQGKMPLSAAMQAACAGDASLWQGILGGGDDYELLMTLPEDRVTAALTIARDLGMSLTDIGSMTSAAGIMIMDQDGRHAELNTDGYRHF